MTSETKKIKEVGKAGVAPQVFVVVMPLTQSAVCPCRQGLGSDELGGLGEGVGVGCSEWIQREREEAIDWSVGVWEAGVYFVPSKLYFPSFYMALFRV